jgi:acyl-coenzyme A synthetase/AMP-(fatty) acid ligase
VAAVLHGEDVAPPQAGDWQSTPAGLDARDRTPARRGVSPGGLAQIIYTSGTTGHAKGVGATHANLGYGISAGPKRRKLAHSRHFLHAFPVGTNGGQMMLVNALDVSPAWLTLPRFTPGRFARLIEARGVGTIFVVPAMAIELLNAGVQDRHDLSSVKLVASTAASLPPAVAASLATAFPKATIANIYTSTEAAPAQTMMIVDPQRPASVGRPLGGAGVVVRDGDGRRAGPGEQGEIWLRSPAGSRAYVGDQRLTEAIFRDGWVRMGDIGYLDADGYLYLIDREGDVIKSGAYKVSTLAVEAALYEHPAIAEAAVTGIPHPVLGKVTGAAVVTRSPVTTADLRAFLMTRLARHELPGQLVFVPELPKNHIGKVQKHRLRELFHSPGGQPADTVPAAVPDPMTGVSGQ